MLSTERKLNFCVRREMKLNDLQGQKFRQVQFTAVSEAL